MLPQNFLIILKIKSRVTMPDNISIGNSVSIRECGLDEYWLQDQIVANPNALGLGELEVISKERQQSSGGRLDILLKDPEDDTMYEVEVMLGETDESHIIRTIEYWDNEKRKWPQRQHYAVLVAESITRRFFNVIHLFSHSIPIIGIQANIIESNGQKFLHFSKILDTYEEPDDSSSISNEVHDENYWLNKSSWTIDNSKALLSIVSKTSPSAKLNFVKNYISIEVNGNNYFWLHKRSSNKSLLSFWCGDFLDDAVQLLDSGSISHVIKNQSIRITVDKQTLESNALIFEEISKLVQRAWK